MFKTKTRMPSAEDALPGRTDKVWLAARPGPEASKVTQPSETAPQSRQCRMRR